MDDFVDLGAMDGAASDATGYHLVSYKLFPLIDEDSQLGGSLASVQVHDTHFPYAPPLPPSWLDY